MWLSKLDERSIASSGDNERAYLVEGVHRSIVVPLPLRWVILCVARWRRHGSGVASVVGRSVKVHCR